MAFESNQEIRELVRQLGPNSRRESQESRFASMSAKAKEFLQSEKRKPINYTINRIERERDEYKRDKLREEKSLAAWFCINQNNYKKHRHNMSDEAYRVKWEELCRLSDSSESELFDSKLAELKRFLYTHKRLPARIGYERSLANWVAAAKQNYRFSIVNMREGGHCRTQWEQFTQQ